MLIFLGDIHGDFTKLDRLRHEVSPNDTIIQVGDFGFYPMTIKEHTKFLEEYPCPILAIDGNHENFDYLDQFPKDQISNVVGNLWYVPRGIVMELEGLLIGFLGGADSIDKAYCVKGKSWFPQETITQDDLNRLIMNVGDRKLDILVTHAAPSRVIPLYFPPLNLRNWGLPPDWKDVSSEMVQIACDALRPEKVICGHMHKSVRYDNIRILHINEAIII